MILISNFVINCYFKLLLLLLIRDVPEVFPAPAPAGKRAFLVLRLRPENNYFVAGKI